VTGLRYLRADVTGRFVSLDERPPTAEALDLLPHPEGGWFRQTWAAEVSFRPPGYPGDRPSATGIYFLLPPGASSAWHAVRSAELWLYHSGSPLPVLAGGSAAAGPRSDPGVLILGPDLAAGQHPQLVIPAGHWQSAGPAGPDETLVSCIVSPGFDFADFTVPGDG
jgi:predicted cupin superfamily sugar epimerase